MSNRIDQHYRDTSINNPEGIPLFKVYLYDVHLDLVIRHSLQCVLPGDATLELMAGRCISNRRERESERERERGGGGERKRERAEEREGGGERGR